MNDAQGSGEASSGEASSSEASSSEASGGAAAGPRPSARAGGPAPAAPPGPPGLVNVANVLTVVRVFLVPLFVVCLIQGGTVWRLCALAAFGVASATDYVDGQLARKRGLVTDFGKIADPIADKALTGAALITLSALGELPGWVTGLILAREVGITVLRFAVIRRGVIAASQGGKLKTLLQIVAICLYVLPASLGLPVWVKEVVMGAALVVTLVTGVDYTVRALWRGQASARKVPAAPEDPGTADRRPPVPKLHGDLAPVRDQPGARPARCRADQCRTNRRRMTWQTASRTVWLARPRASWPPRSSGC